MVIALFAITACVSSGPKVDNAKMAEGYYMKGLAFFQEKKYELAAVEFHRSIQTDSSQKWSYYYLGYISDTQDKLDEAITYYKQAIDVDGDFSEAYNALGAAYSRQQRWNEALKAYKQALENKLYATPHIPWVNIGRVYMAQKNYEKAVEAFREAKRYASLDFIVYELGNAFLDAGKTKEAVRELEEGVKMLPQNAVMRYSLATAYLKGGNKKAAVAEFKKVIQLAPKTDVAAKAKDYINTLR